MFNSKAIIDRFNLKDVLPFLLIYFSGSLFLVLENHKFLGMYSMNGFDWIVLWENWHDKLVNLEGDAPNQYRYLSFMIAEMISKIFNLQAFYSYQLQSFICTFLTCVVLHLFFQKWASDKDSCIGVLIFLLINILSFSYFIQPSEPLNILFFALAALLLSRDKVNFAVIVAILGALNKSTVIFLAPLFFFYILFSRPKKITVFVEALSYGLITVLGVACTQLLIMNFTGKKKYYCDFWQYKNNFIKLENDLLAWVFVIIAIVPIFIIWKTWDRQPKVLRAASMMSVPFVLGHFMIASVDEFRIFIPLICFNIPALLILLKFKYFKLKD